MNRSTTTTTTSINNTTSIKGNDIDQKQKRYNNSNNDIDDQFNNNISFNNNNNNNISINNNNNISINNNISFNNNIDSDLKRLLFEEIFLSGSMPNVTRYLSEQFIDYIEGNMKDYKLIPYIVIFSIDILLRGISQVFLCNHPITGIFVLIGISFTSLELVGYALLGTLFGTTGAIIIGRPLMNDVTSGLTGYDGALVGCACYSFLVPSYRVIITTFLSFLSGIVHVACANILNTLELPTFTLAFNIIMVCFLLSVTTNHSNVTTLQVNSSNSSNSSNSYPDNYTNMSINFFVDASIRGVGQFMFVDTTIGSAFVLLE